MALISMAVWDTEENERTIYTRKTLESLLDTVDFTKHRLIISDNGSCKRTHDLYTEFFFRFRDKYPYNNKIEIIYNGKNLGTAEGINKAWKERIPGENAIKMDNDVIIHQSGWVDELEYAIRLDKEIGIVGLKRKDCWENPMHTDPFYKSQLKMLPHNPGEPWVVVEKVNHVMGTCQMYSSALLDKIGYLQQPALYGFDDSWAAARSIIAGFYNAFLPHIKIDHIDAGDKPYQQWKQKHANDQWQIYHQTLAAWKNGTKSVYYNPFK